MTEKVDILIRARDAFGRVLGKAKRQLGEIEISAKGLKKAFLVVTASLGGMTLALTKMFKIGAGALETQSKFNTVFGESAAKLDEFADSFGKLAGLTKSEAQGLLATTGAIVQGMGLSTEASADFARQVVTLAGDLQSFNDIPIAETALAIQGAITGEREMLKRLGIVIKEVDVQQRAMADSGKSSASAITQQEKVAATLALVMERAGKAVGDLPRTAGSAANFARQVGRDFRQIIEDVSTGLVPALASVLPILRSIAEALVPIAEKIADMAIGLTDAVGFTNVTARTNIDRIRGLGAGELEGEKERLQSEISGIQARRQAAFAQPGGAGLNERDLQVLGDRVSAALAGEDVAVETRSLADLTSEFIGLSAAMDFLTERMKALRTATPSIPHAPTPIDVGAPRGVIGGINRNLAAGGALTALPTQPGLSVRGAGFGAAADPTSARLFGGARSRSLELQGEVQDTMDSLAEAAGISSDMGVTVVDNFAAMARAGIEGTAGMERQMVSSMSAILQAAVGGGVKGAIIGGIAGLVGSLFGGGNNRPTPVRVESYSSEALNQRKEDEGMQAITVQIVSPLDNSTLSQYEYWVNRRQRLDGVPRVPLNVGTGR